MKTAEQIADEMNAFGDAIEANGKIVAKVILLLAGEIEARDKVITDKDARLVALQKEILHLHERNASRGDHS